MSTELLAEYQRRYQAVLSPSAALLEAILKGHLDGCERIDRIRARAKQPERFVTKAVKLAEGSGLRNPEPFVQIQDTIGAGVVVFYQSDIDETEQTLKKYLRTAEVKSIVPDSEWKFGYFGRHFIVKLPSDAVPEHAWSEAEHDLGYKPARRA